MLVDVTPRLYQQTILGTCVEKNTLVVLPTGMGKTLIALMLASARLKAHPDKKIVMISPTRPLVEQHARSFREQTTLDAEKIVIFTGQTPAKKRARQWEEAQIICSTPQGLENDVMARRVNFKDVALLIFDEAHRAVGDYAYVYLAQQYTRQAKAERILALTASPGSDMEKISEVLANLCIEDIEVRTPEDPDVKPYIQDVQVDWVSVPLPTTFQTTLQALRDCQRNKLHAIKEHGYTNRTTLNRMELLKLQGSLHGEMAQGDRSYELLKSLSLVAEAMKVEHAIELLESQGVRQTIAYLEKLDQDAKTSKTKAVKNLVQDMLFRKALINAQELQKQGIEHPKLTKLQSLLQELEQGEKAIIFTQYRASAETIARALEAVNVESAVFVGQAKKRGKGLSQKEQISLLERFRNGAFSVLVATSVAEEGLDIPKVDHVIFYEPIPSAIRSIQRRGRTGRTAKGAVHVLFTKGTRDEAYRWSARHKEKNMYSTLKRMGNRLKVELNKQETLKRYAQEDVRIYADHRERGSGVMKHLLDAGIALDVHQLPLGDYLLSSRVCVEFKTVQDFVQSIIDGRLLEQLVEMKRHFSRPLLVIQGVEDMYSVRQVHPNAIRGVLSTVIVKLGIPLLQTRNAHETGELLLNIAKKEQEQFGKDFTPHGNKRPRTIKEQQEYVVSALPGVGFGLAKPLLRYFKNIKSLVNASEEELRSVELIGTKKAKALRDMLDHEWNE